MSSQKYSRIEAPMEHYDKRPMSLQYVRSVFRLCRREKPSMWVYR